MDVQPEPKKCWRCGIAVPDTEDHCLNCRAPTSGKTLLEDVGQAGELEELRERVRGLEGLPNLVKELLVRFNKIEVVMEIKKRKAK